MPTPFEIKNPHLTCCEKYNTDTIDPHSPNKSKEIDLYCPCPKCQIRNKRSGCFFECKTCLGFERDSLKDNIINCKGYLHNANSNRN